MHRITALAALLALLVAAGACSNEDVPAASGPLTADAPATREPGAAITAGPRSSAAPRPATAPQRRAIPRLQARLAALLADPTLELEGELAVEVLDPRGYRVLSSDADRALVPASTMKVVTAAAALVALGPDHRFTTELRSTSPVGTDGVVHGDLVLVGSGDPALATPAFAERAYPDRPRTRLEDLADGVLTAGIRRITGDVVGDPTVFADEPLAPGWTERYLLDLDGARASGLTVDAGRDVTYREDGTAIGVASQDPARTAAARLTDLLLERGVIVDGGPRSTTSAIPAAVQIASVQSPPLEQTLRYLVLYSDNPLTDGIFRSLGALAGRQSTWRSSAAAVRRALGPLGLDWTGVVLADGSGLSRDDRLSASFLADLDRTMHLSEHADTWARIMAVAGSSGTMRGRLRGTLAAGLLRGKTGTLDDVRAFVGSAGTPTGRYHLAVIGNDLAGVSRDRVRLLQDEIALLLVEDLLGCDRVPVAVDAAPSPGASPRSTARLEGNRVICPG